jgi:hypothetical protein
MGFNIKINFKEVKCNDVSFSRLVQNMGQWQAVVSAVMNLRFS